DALRAPARRLPPVAIDGVRAETAVDDGMGMGCAPENDEDDRDDDDDDDDDAAEVEK
ncbi:hypothetical protein HDU67_009735, partial [Dinochytrium kinnereticum]